MDWHRLVDSPAEMVWWGGVALVLAVGIWAIIKPPKGD
jgi:hypothetical protein